MNKKKTLKFMITIGCFSIILLQIFFAKGFTDYIGTDDRSIEIINELAPIYQPWVKNIWEPQNDWAEILMFVLQASIGLRIIIFYLLKQRQKVKTKA